MNTVATLYDRIGLPLALVEDSGACSAELPDFVRAHVAKARLWHLIAWHDGASDTFGLWHKGKAAAFERMRLAHLSVQAATPARGPGWISLTVRLADAPVSNDLLAMRGFREDTYEWLLSQVLLLQQLSGAPVSSLGAYPDV